MTAKRLPKGWRMIHHVWQKLWVARHSSGVEVWPSGALLHKPSEETALLSIDELLRVRECVKRKNGLE